MKEIQIHLDDNSHPIDIHFDSGVPTPINAFLFLSSVPHDPPMGHVLAFGCSDVIGRLIYGFWMQTVDKNPEGAFTIEAVCRDIIKTADAARSNKYVTGEEPKEGGKFH